MSGNVGYVFAKRYRRPVRQLKRLEIDEVSAVSRGAGEGTRVLLMKGHNTEGENDVMAQIQKGGGGLTYHSIAKAAVEAAGAGQISEHKFGEVQKQLALSMFPHEPNEGKALARFFDTSVGKATLAARPRVSAARNIELMKAERAGEERPRGEGRANIPDESDDEDDDQPIKQSPYFKELLRAAEDHRQSAEGKGMTSEQAFTHVATKTKSGRVLLDADRAWHLHRRAA
jgi:hypothetical protein